MAEALNEIFTLEELEISEIEECASVPNFYTLAIVFGREEETFALVKVKASVVLVFATMEILCALIIEEL